MGLVQEFKQFAVRGNVIDLAVGVVVGAAFGKIVSSLVGDIVMPVLGKIVGGVSFEDMGTSLGMGPDGQTEIVLKWGAFVQTIFDFTLIAAALFMAIKAINRLKAAPAPTEPAAPPAPPRNEVLLEEIRDLLKK
ncbi:MAG: large-conductance mechanosensitive channel protein MscL [Sinobacteraceae bacterium]|nr:large-conductance mechanosensitive channel protein MscL [Nevskiaceae bacterium]